jgi:hypothetical protein
MKYKFYMYIYIFCAQIIIEAVRGAGYVSDTAIDDVKIANGSECLATVTNVPSLRKPVNQSESFEQIYFLHE